MGYTKVISYSNKVEIFEFENDYKPVKRKKKIAKATYGDIDIDVLGRDRKKQFQSTRTKENARRTVLVFRRLVASNLADNDRPVLITFTYSENITEIRQARADFQHFVRAFTNKLQADIRFICVPEFQKRGAIHFHALFWGVSPEMVARERQTRFIARLWRKGYIDIVQTDGHQKISTYLSKYMAKAFTDKRLSGKRAYTCSRNLKRPIVDKNTIIEPYYYGYNGINLSTALNLQDRTYMTQYLGKCRYRLFEINK